MAEASEVVTLYGSDRERQEAFLALSVVVGGGVLGYQIGRAIKDGDLWKTDPVPVDAKAGPLAMGGGLVMFGMMLRETAKEYGWGKVLGVTAAMTAVVYGVRAVRS